MYCILYVMCDLQLYMSVTRMKRDQQRHAFICQLGNARREMAFIGLFLCVFLTFCMRIAVLVSPAMARAPLRLVTCKRTVRLS